MHGTRGEPSAAAGRLRACAYLAKRPAGRRMLAAGRGRRRGVPSGLSRLPPPRPGRPHTPQHVTMALGAHHRLCAIFVAAAVRSPACVRLVTAMGGSSTSCSGGITCSGCSCQICLEPSRPQCHTGGGHSTRSLCVAHGSVGSHIWCGSCSPGQYQDAATSTCTPCPLRTYQPAAGTLPSCIACAAGFVAEVGAGTGVVSSGATTCTACGPGTFSPLSSQACAACGAGSATNTLASAGASSCTSCTPGRYSTGGVSACHICAAGSTTNTLVAPGAHMCIACAVRHFSAQSTVACATCAAGSTTDTLASVGATSCTACPAGTYSTQSAVACSSCPAGSVTNTLTGSGAVLCTACAPGRSTPDSRFACSPFCAALSTVRLPRTQVVVAGCARGGTPAASSTCVLGCVDGYRAVGATNGVCTANAAGTSATYVGQSVNCTPASCATLVPAWPHVILYGCGAGATVNDPSGVCLLSCADGYVMQGAVVGRCRPVPNSSTASYQGQRAMCRSVACSSGSISVAVGRGHICICIKGYSRIVASADCAKCPIGKFKDSVSDTDACVSCSAVYGADTTTLGAGSTDISDCICKEGHYRSGLGCAPCVELQGQELGKNLGKDPQWDSARTCPGGSAVDSVICPVSGLWIESRNPAVFGDRNQQDAASRHSVALIACEGAYQCRRRPDCSGEDINVTRRLAVANCSFAAGSNCTVNLRPQPTAQCGPHHTGFLCAECEAGFAKVVGKCVKCSGADMGTIFCLLIEMVLVGLLMLYKAIKVVCPVTQADAVFRLVDEDGSGHLDRAEVHALMQRMGNPLAGRTITCCGRTIVSDDKTLGQMTGDKNAAGVTLAEFRAWCLVEQVSAATSISVFGLQTFGLIARQSEFFGVLEAMNFRVEAITGSCLAPMSAFSAMVTIALVPGGAILVVLIAWAALRTAMLGSVALKGHHLQRALLSIALFAFAPITRSCMSLLVCRDVGRAVPRLAADMSIECYREGHLEIATAAAIVLVCYAVLFPLFLLYKVRSVLAIEAKAVKDGNMTPSTLQPRAWDMLVRTVRPGTDNTTLVGIGRLIRHGWFAWIMLFKLGVTLVILLGEIFRFEWGMWLQISLIFFALFSHRVRPYGKDKDNFLEQLILLLLAAIMAIVNAAAAGEKTGAQDVWQRKDMAIVVCLGLCVIGAGISNIIELKLHRYKLKKQLKLRSKIDIMFNEADRGSQKDGHGDMFLGLEEVQALFVQQGLETSAEEVAALFERYDVDKSGKIDRAEFEDLGHKVQRLLGKQQRQQIDQGSLGSKISSVVRRGVRGGSFRASNRKPPSLGVTGAAASPPRRRIASTRVRSRSGDGPMPGTERSSTPPRHVGKDTRRHRVLSSVPPPIDIKWTDHTDGYCYKQNPDGSYDPQPHWKDGHGNYIPYAAPMEGARP
jgi:Ca2+-binding EF-hand superfamily protein